MRFNVKFYLVFDTFLTLDIHGTLKYNAHKYIAHKIILKHVIRQGY